MDDVFYVRTTAQWKALSHPLRVAILKLLTEKAMTNERLAAALHQESGKLYFHTKQLLESGLIRIAETKMRGTIAEKVYRAVARTYAATGLPNTASEEVAAIPPFDSALTGALDIYRQTWSSVTDQPHLGGSYTVHMPQDQAEEFGRRLCELVSEFRDKADGVLADPALTFSFLLHALPNNSAKAMESVIETRESPRIVEQLSEMRNTIDETEPAMAGV